MARIKKIAKELILVESQSPAVRSAVRALQAVVISTAVAYLRSRGVPA